MPENTHLPHTLHSSIEDRTLTRLLIRIGNDSHVRWNSPITPWQNASTDAGNDFLLEDLKQKNGVDEANYVSRHASKTSKKEQKIGIHKGKAPMRKESDKKKVKRTYHKYVTHMKYNSLKSTFIKRLFH